MAKLIPDVKALEALRKKSLDERKGYKQVIAVCGGTGCHAYGCMKVIEAFRAELAKQGLAKDVRLRTTGCHGFCEMGSLCIIHPSDIFYVKITPEDVAEVVSETVKAGKVIDRLCYTDPASKKKVVKAAEVPFYKNQHRLLFAQNGMVDPKDLDDYLAIGGFSGAAAALCDLKPRDIIDKIKASGLRGRGGGGFPTGRKWEICASHESDVRYIVCNADEGDPGAYMDRSILEGNPFAVIEGMIVGAKAIGAAHGYVYVRNEYPLAVENLGAAIVKAREAGLLGEDILKTGFSFDITINRGGGAFVCGEETGLISSVMGLTGEPNPKPPYPAQRGLWGKPTVINNVETWANVPMILSKGEKWFAGMGTANSKGTKVFSLVGKINNTGLVEVPMGITLRKIVYDIGGGIPGGRKFKAVQTGGPSGGCLPESMLDSPVDFDELTKMGSMMGSGGMIVMDDRTCMVDVAHYFMKFLSEESCGKCVPCREGVPRMKAILEDITNGKGSDEAIALLQELGETVRDASLCALGGTSPNPVLSTLKYFRDEYEAHIRDKRCPAGVCKALINYSVIEDRCTGCGACARVCPTQAAVATGRPATVKGKKHDKLKAHEIVQEKCIKCGACIEACKFDAIKVE
ncbi:MAG: 4Fe-4S binding protein [Proteobacteria bacterium]|nr:4Fe-4S binding protein [Pseudomonadota bacterium]